MDHDPPATATSSAFMLARASDRLVVTMWADSQEI